MFELIQVRKLAAVEMAALGTQVTVSAYALGIVLPLLFGLFSLVLNLTGAQPADWQVAVGAWMLSVALNYTVLLGYALSILRAGTARHEGQAELAHATRYSTQQVIVLIPLLVVALALAQERQRRQAMP
jgi:hypothetical protein